MADQTRLDRGAIGKLVTAYGGPAFLMCDGHCEKAWGINNRPRRQLSATDEDDYEFLADGELGEAPDDPGTYEGGHAKPRDPGERLNKWCFRECERAEWVGYRDFGKLIALPDFSRPVRNKPATNGEAK